MTTPRFDVDVVLFDLDGTLLDTIPDLHEAARRMLEELGEPVRSIDEVTRFVGRGIPNLVERCLTDGRAPRDAATIEAAVAVFRRHYGVVNGHSTRIYEGVAETLAALQAQGIRMACITNKAGAFTLPLLDHMGLARFFGCVVSGDTLPVKKPDPAPLLHACDALGVSPTRALMVGDSANDALAAQSAGIPVLLMTYGYSEGRAVDTIECDGLVSAFPGLLRLIGRASA
ncbi:phosphoglycolate phosphatase [Niveibacterium sp.]|uniref:phosphoglycolate phosphatase n=1 Tax=Niveibacterium sp. TaxID=2017444 RepID=UPI0035B44E02